MGKEFKISEALITEINFEPRFYKKYYKRGNSSDYYKNGAYYCYRHGIYSEYKPARITITLKVNDEEFIYDISDEIRKRCGGALKKEVVDSLYATLPDKVVLNELNEISEESYSQWIKEANELRRAV